MPQILIFADDLTGTNDTAAMVHQYGYEAYAVVDLLKERRIPKDCECLGINLDSRGGTEDEAKSCMEKAVTYYLSGSEELYSKRIDSTLRGYLGIETDTLIKELGDERTAMIVPALPDAGRQFYNGVLYVHGIPLHETAAAKDPSHPISTSSPGQLFQQQSAYKTCEIPLEAVRGETKSLVNLITEKRTEGYRNLIFEAMSNEDIDWIALAVMESQIPFVAVDPGTFTCRLAARMKMKEESQSISGENQTSELNQMHDLSHKKILAVVGSVNQVSKMQMKQVMEHYHATVKLEIATLIESEECCEAAIDSACEQILKMAETNNVCILVLSSVLETDHTPFQVYAREYNIKVEDIIQRVNTAIARTTSKILEQDKSFSGLFTCGGDITLAVCNELQASVILRGLVRKSLSKRLHQKRSPIRQPVL